MIPIVALSIIASAMSLANADEQVARAYLVETSSPGYTMEKQGSDVAIDRLHPEFADRLAGLIAEARMLGIEASIFSAYRPPAFGVGGFSDKYKSFHSYGLAVDLKGIGMPGSFEAAMFHRLAKRHGIACIYGPNNRAEWNHCQATWLHVANGELKATIFPDKPKDLTVMWDSAESILAWNTTGKDVEPDRYTRLALYVRRRHRTTHVTRSEDHDTSHKRARRNHVGRSVADHKTTFVGAKSHNDRHVRQLNRRRRREA